MFDISIYDKWLIATTEGMRVSNDVPDDVREDIKTLNHEYRELGHDEDLLTFDYSDRVQKRTLRK